MHTNIEVNICAWKQHAAREYVLSHFQVEDSRGLLLNNPHTLFARAVSIRALVPNNPIV